MENENKISKKGIIVFILVLIGILVTIDLAYIYYQANFNSHALPSFCSVNEFIDCDGVARTVESQFLGVPLALWGLFLYSFMILMLWVDKLKKIPFLKFLEVFKNKYHYIASLGLISFVISMLLLAVSLGEIHKLCVMCVVTYCLNLLIGMAAAHGIEGHFIGAVKQSWIDFVEALKPIPYRIAFSVVMVLASVGLYWTYSSAVLSPALAFYRNYGEFTQTKINKYAVKGNVLGSKDENAVVLHVYSDFKCPICFTCNIMVHKLVREFKNLRVEHHNMPLDMECNPHLKNPFHVGSCINAQYASAAKKQGKFWEVESVLFEQSPNSEDEILYVLKQADLGLDLDKLKQDANSTEIKNEIKADMDYAASQGKIGTPSLKIGDDFEMGVKGYPKLKEWVKQHGGIERHTIFQ